MPILPEVDAYLKSTTQVRDYNSETDWKKTAKKVLLVVAIVLTGVVPGLLIGLGVWAWKNWSSEEAGIPAVDTAHDRLMGAPNQRHQDKTSSRYGSTEATDTSQLLPDIESLLDGFGIDDVIDAINDFALEKQSEAVVALRDNVDLENAIISSVEEIKEVAVPAIQQAINEGKCVVFIPVNLGNEVELLTLRLGRIGEPSSIHMSSDKLRSYLDPLEKALRININWPETVVDVLLEKIRQGYINESFLGEVVKRLGASHPIAEKVTLLQNLLTQNSTIKILKEALRNKFDFLVMRNSLKGVFPERLPGCLQANARLLKEMNEYEFQESSERMQVFEESVNQTEQHVQQLVNREKDDIGRINHANRSLVIVEHFDGHAEDLRSELMQRIS